MPTAYLDNNATTRPDPAVVAAMVPFLVEQWGNPSSVHRFGQAARNAIDEARAQLASLVACRASELIFTGGGTEASNTAIRGLLRARAPRNHILVSAVEHSATRALCSVLADAGEARVTDVGVEESGRVDAARVADALGEDTALVSMIWANNETGAISDVAAIAEACRSRRVPFHCDATQAVGKIPVDFAALGVDCATLAAHKFHGPKGVGALYVRRGVRVEPLIIGGPQERERRGGTENVAGIVGTGVAARLAADHLGDMPRVAGLRDRLERGIIERLADVRINGDPDHRLPNTTNLGFAQLEAEAILLILSERGVYASAGAACSSGSLEASPILRAMNVPETYAHGSVRFSLSRFTTDAEVDLALSEVPAAVERLRRILPMA